MRPPGTGVRAARDAAPAALRQHAALAGAHPQRQRHGARAPPLVGQHPAARHHNAQHRGRQGGPLLVPRCSLTVLSPTSVRQSCYNNFCVFILL